MEPKTGFFLDRILNALHSEQQLESLFGARNPPEPSFLAIPVATDNTWHGPGVGEFSGPGLLVDLCVEGRRGFPTLEGDAGEVVTFYQNIDKMQISLKFQKMQQILVF